jgi:DNA-binding NarL/FixJ family response regulator
MRHTILLVDDHPGWLTALERLLEREFEICGRARNAADAIRFAAELRPDVVTMDITMPEIDGLEAAKRIRSVSPNSRIVFVTVHADRDYTRAALEIGAWGYVLKYRAVQDLEQAIRSCLAAEPFTSPGVGSTEP